MLPSMRGRKGRGRISVVLATRRPAPHAKSLAKSRVPRSAERPPTTILVCSCGSQRSFERSSMILVTGGTGLIGSEVLRLLSHADVPARAVVRNPSPGHALPGITWVSGDLAKPETPGSVFAGCTKLFLLTG